MSVPSEPAPPPTASAAGQGPRGAEAGAKTPAGPGSAAGPSPPPTQALPPPQPRGPAVLRSGLRLALGGGLLAALLALVDPQALGRSLAGADPAWLLLGLASAVTANTLSALRWWAMARWLGAAVSPAWALARYAGGVALNALLPGAVVGGDLYRAHALRRQGLGWTAAGLSVLVDRLAGLWMLGVLALAAAAVALGGEAPEALLDPLAGLLPAGLQAALRALPAAGLAAGCAGLALACTLLPLGLAGGPRVGGAAPATPSRAPPAEGVDSSAACRLPAAPATALPRAADIAGPPQGTDPAPPPRAQALRALARRPGARGQLGLQLLASLGVQLFSLGTLGCAGLALGVMLPAWAWAVAALPIFVMATLPISFGGWGTREAAAVLVLGAFGVAAPLALGIGLLYGLAALAQALPGAAVLAAERRGR